MMLNANNIGLAWYKTVKVATLNSITQILNSHTMCPQLMLTQGHISLCLTIIGAFAGC
jgi:hypothetical protein